ncbi:MAG TPA: CoA transferase [Acidimicrobiales bacterium]|nr:CoA transferase [Acidimicrobiales bacterium]
MPDAPLAGLRVLDLTTDRAELCGRTLAELGADVVKVESPQGSPSRKRPPFGPNGSLYWDAVAFGKASVVADLTTDEGRAGVRRLALAADVLVESFDPGFLSSIGLGHDDLARENPGLITVSVTPYGQTGPKAGWAASELTIEAAGGRLALQRDGDRPPVPVGFPQAAFHAGVQAAADALVAVHERRLSGLGQHLDVSMQAVMVHTTMSQTSGARNNDAAREAVGTMDDPDAARAARLLLLPGIWACADGFVAAPLTAGALPLLAHVIATGADVDDDLKAYDWTRLVADVLRGRIDDDLVERGVAVLAGFLAERTKRELFALAFSGDFRLGPLQTTRDLLDDDHLRARGYWVEVDGSVRPGPAVRFSATPMRDDRPAPAVIGTETVDEVADRWAVDLRPAEPSGIDRDGEAFRGLKVADFSWVAVGPTIGRAFADHGATVVRVESRRRMDVARTLAPWKGTAKGIDDSIWYAHHNAGKLGLSLDLSMAAGRQVARRLIDWADVVIESFSPGTMARLGLDYATVAETNPGLVMLSTSLLGQTGPMASFAGFGQQAVGLCGISTVTGWPDRPPIPPMGAYTDVIAPKYGIAAVAAALLARERDGGRGQHIDLSQVEASIRFIEPLVLDETVNRRTAVRPGAVSQTACPHGAFAVAVPGRYVAVAVETEDQWRALRRVSGGALAAFADDLDLDARIARRDAIDAALGSWIASAKGEADEVAERLATSGVPAARVAKPAQVARDPQLEHREFFVPFDHPAMGRCDYEGLPTRFSAKRRQLHGPAPCLGQHTDVVLRDLLCCDDDEIAGLRSADVLQ